jgi:hypothetical protein
MIVRALKTIQGRHPAGSIHNLRDKTAQQWIAMGIAEPVDEKLAEYATGPGVTYLRPQPTPRRRKPRNKAQLDTTPQPPEAA